VFAIIALSALGLAACGGGDSSDSTATATASQGTTAASTTEDRGSAKSKKEQGDDKGGSSQGSDDSGTDDSGSSAGKGSAAFRTPGGDNSIQNFGDEADAAEVAAASTVLAAYLRTRAKDEWAQECAYLAKAAIAPLEELAGRSPQLKGKGCAAILAALGSGVPASARANTMTSGIASLRFEGDRGFALYHGPKGVNYFVPMVKEGGEWKVGALAPSEFP
jgi:hypothetical protein